ncbi:MAG: Gfo/Idh/MocA family oxidoreductase [Thermoguttaceae bacterium]|nr:Gfo/Idh/MocA family oxidoreductase [Thermoguttaceae bacterium]
MRRLRVAVVGCGYMGSLHAEKLAQLSQADLIAVVDPLPEARLRVAARCGAAPLADFRLLFLERLDAVVIAVPTPFHARVAMEFLVRGIHVLVEKPLASSVDEAGSLVEAAEKAGVILQVGHIERFNPVFELAASQCESPVFINSVRCGKLARRTLATDVVIDLLIHDLDLVLGLSRSPLVDVQAVGWSLFGETIDFAQAWLRFSGGMVSICAASRVSAPWARRMQIFQKDSLLELDFASRRVCLRRKAPELSANSDDNFLRHVLASEPPTADLFDRLLPPEVFEFGEADPLKAELVDFLSAINDGRQPRVDGYQGLRALALAEQIKQQILCQLAEAPAAGQLKAADLATTPWPAGPHWPLVPSFGTRRQAAGSLPVEKSR